MPKITVSIVVYRPDLSMLGLTLSSLGSSIRHVAERYGLEAKLSVVDNSCDPSVLPGIRSVIDAALAGIDVELVVSPSNCGYGAANNLVILDAVSDLHLVANPDIILNEDALSRAWEYLDAHPEVVLLTPAVRGEDGVRHYLCKHHPSLLIMLLRGFAPVSVKRIFKGMLDRFEMRDSDYTKEIDQVGYPTGCFMLFRTGQLQAIRGFDEDFFMYLEDADIGRRIGRLGAVRYVPSVKIVHQWARGSHTNWRLRWVTIQSVFIYWSKWGGTFRPSGR